MNCIIDDMQCDGSRFAIVTTFLQVIHVHAPDRELAIYRIQSRRPMHLEARKADCSQSNNYTTLNGFAALFVECQRNVAY